MNILKAIVTFLCDECGAVSGSFPQGGGFSYALTSPEETSIAEFHKPRGVRSPYRTDNTGLFKDLYARDFADAQYYGREKAMTQRMQNQARMMRSDIQKRDIVNALLGGGKVRITGPLGESSGSVYGRGNSLDPTKQFATLLGMVGGQDDDTLDASGTTGGAGADYQQLYNQLSNLMSQRGGSYEQDIRQSADEASKTAAARMQARGLSGSTLVDASNARIMRDRNSALNKLHDTLLGQDIGALTNVGVEGLKAKQRQSEFKAQMRLAGGDRRMKMLQTLLGA